MSSPPFRPDIQGLRAIAVLAVVVFHAVPQALPGGFVGVDMFFVISGYLIGGIVKRDMEAGGFSLAEFYRKRARRIFPALVAMLLVTMAAGAVFLPPEAFAELGRTAAAAALFVSNVDFFRHSGYFDPAAELRPLLHTWSLAVEEQFYLLFPPVLWAILRYAPRLLRPLTVLAILASLLASQWALGRSPMGAYFLSPFRGFELLIGAYASWFPWARAQRLTAWAGFTLIGASLALLTPDIPFPGLWALPPTLGTAFLLVAGRGWTPLVSRLLGLKPLLFFGAISYSLYLWHWPLMAYLRILVPHPAWELMAAAVGASVLAGWVSWRYIERPFQKADPARQPILRAGLGALIMVGLTGTALWGTQGLPQRFSPQISAYFAAAHDYSPWRDSCHQQDNARLPYDRTCILGGSRAMPPDLVVWGDSHGTELAAALAPYHPLRQITASACPPVTGVDIPQRPNCRTANAAILDALVADAGASTVILTVNRAAYPDHIEGFEAGYAQVVTRLAKAGKTVIQLGQIPNPDIEAPQVAGLAVLWRRDPHEIGPAVEMLRRKEAGWRRLQNDLASPASAVALIDPLPALCTQSICPITEAGSVLYFNPRHLSMAGARKLVPLVLPILAP